MDADFLSLGTQILSGAFVLLLPGYVWVTWFPTVGEGPIRRLGDAVGLSLALNALLALFAFYLRFRLTPLILLVIYAILGILASIALFFFLRKILFQIRVQIRRYRAPSVGGMETHQDDEAPALVSDRGSDANLLVVALLLGLGILIAWRLYQTRNLSLPAWVDSIHHVLIVRLFLESGGVPESFGPYMPVPFYYHFAFHQSAALFAFWTRLPPAQAVLVLGQVLNAAVALSVYRLGLAIWSDWRKAGAAGLLVGFVSQMPAYYATWGRYTLLTGLILLPLAMGVAVEISRLGGTRHRVARLALLTAGSLLSHYFTALLLALFLIILAIATMLSRPQTEHPVSPIRTVTRLLRGSLLGLLIALPWLLRVWEYARLYTSLTTVSVSDSLDTIFFSDYLNYLWYLLGPQRNYVLLGIAGLGILVAGWRPGSRVLTVWAIALGLIGLPWGINIPPFRPDHALIVLFLPVTLLIANGLFTIWDRFQERRLAVVGRLLVFAMLISLLVWGIRDTGKIINPVTVLADEMDVQALAWVEENTPPDARFFINVTLWQTSVYRGVDGGWWILPLTGRQTLIPPAMYVLGEYDFVTQTNTWAAQAAEVQDCTPAFWDLIQAAQIDYLYLREGKGSLQADGLLGCEGLESVYQDGGVVIYRIQ